jgi:hypothetical protein
MKLDKNHKVVKVLNSSSISTLPFRVISVNVGLDKFDDNDKVGEIDEVWALQDIVEDVYHVKEDMMELSDMSPTKEFMLEGGYKPVLQQHFIRGVVLNDIWDVSGFTYKPDYSLIKAPWPPKQDLQRVEMHLKRMALSNWGDGPHLMHILINTCEKLGKFSTDVTPWSLNACEDFTSGEEVLKMLKGC